MPDRATCPRLRMRLLFLAAWGALLAGPLKPRCAEGASARSLLSGGAVVSAFNPTSYTPGKGVTVSIAVTPDASVGVWALEDTPPAGWAISAIDNGGGLDTVNGKVKWGVFFSNSPLTVSYVATPPSGERGARTFSGQATFDNVVVPIGGARSIPNVVVPLTVCKRAAPSVASGKNLTYVISYGNISSTAASGVLIKDTLPPGTTFVSATDGGSLSNGIVTWNIGNLSPQTIARAVSLSLNITGSSGTLTNGVYTIEAAGIPPSAGPAVATAVTSNCPTPLNALLLSGGHVAVTAAFQSQYELGVTCPSTAIPIPQNDRFGYLHFGDVSNPELFVKVLDFGGDSYLVFFGTLSDLQLTVTFTNLQTCQSVVFTKPAGGSCGASDGASLKK